VLLPPIAPPGPGLDPQLALALGISASPGAYAMLLGSGTSTAAGIPTGWEVVCDLIRRVAALHGPEELHEAQADPVRWWTSQGQGEPRYDALLEALAPSVAARRDLLCGYFEPATQEEREQGIKRPTAAHRAMAELVHEGRLRLILTTNFDHLIEDALAAAGTPPQVIARPEAIAGMTPLQHARATVVKLHGDYLDVGSVRNTSAELAAYDPAMQELLDRVLDEYGLIILGWSGQWDTALARAIEGCPSRRYPTYWAAFNGQISPSGERLLAGRAGHLIPIKGADTFCTALRDKVNMLARMADPPPTRDVAVAALKRNLRPGRQIELFDQLNLAAERTIDRLTEDRYPVGLDSWDPLVVAAELERQLADYDSDTEVLAALVATTAFHGDSDSDVHILRVVRRLTSRPRLTSWSVDALGAARRYPALRIVTCIGVAATASGREDLLVSLLSRTTSATLDLADGEVALLRCLYPASVLDGDALKLVPRYQLDVGATYPSSRYLRTSCRVPLSDVTDGREYAAAFDRYEFLRGMMEVDYDPGTGAALGDVITAEQGLHGFPHIAEISSRWPLVAAGAFDGDLERARSAFAAVRQQIGERRLS
jgi:hypothetical protein